MPPTLLHPQLTPLHPITPLSHHHYHTQKPQVNVKGLQCHDKGWQCRHEGLQRNKGLYTPIGVEGLQRCRSPFAELESALSNDTEKSKQPSMPTASFGASSSLLVAEDRRAHTNGVNKDPRPRQGCGKQNRWRSSH
ncbi:Hypothetical predicted protein [Olea europaea subsp. europaea]|uniref:Uncharacterized protein n=1 Tax=Olea europaea subsp. europaea TaxID=158383 RepID=A0A8S0THU5_OLEEU|nr:Hypothetical predicted protein [Olea europaea subsp. europaea]